MKRLAIVIIVIVLTAMNPVHSDEAVEELETRLGSITVVTMETSMGTIMLGLFNEKSPETVRNFLRYVDENFYDGTIIHRVIPGFIIQGGGLTADFELKETHESIKNEAFNKLKNKRGTISMARTGIIDSATSQFFINLADNDVLDHKNDTVSGYGYAVFGQVISGMDVVDKIASRPTGEKFLDPENKRGLYFDVPVETVLINSIRRE
jgi:cyclophilin family peptidyl-prolyl cis-trans isomerase